MWVNTLTLKRFEFLTLLLLTLLVGIFVWPTRFRYDRLKSGDSEFPVRIDRLTGRAEYFAPRRGWIRDDLESFQPSQELPPADLSKLNCNASIRPPGLFECELYNGSE